MTPPDSKIARLVIGCFFVSGAAGLIYEVLWIRMLGLIFGHTVHAITTVLVAFMGGLALGSYLAGRFVDRARNPLRLYAVLEIAIGVYCLAIPWLMAAVQSAYLGIARSFDISFTVFVLVQFVLVTVILLVPTTLMGATLPILSRFLVSHPRLVGNQVGRLYAFNTFGAVLGVYLAGFELLPVLGARLTVVFAAVMNVGIGALVLSRLKNPGMVEISEPSPGHSEAVGRHWRNLDWFLAAGFAVSGALSMIYEIAWTRALSLIIGSSTYAFSAMLLSFLAGIAIGSALFSHLSQRWPAVWSWFGVLQVGIGLSAAFCLPLFERLPLLFLDGFRISGSFGFVLALQVLICFGIMMVPTLLIGATFPCVAQLVSRDLSGIGRDVGRAYAWNTVGAIIGSFTAGFVLIPMLGVQSSIKMAVVFNLVLGLAFLLVHFRGILARLMSSLAMAAAVFLLLMLPQWNRSVMSAGVSVHPREYLQSMQSSGELGLGELLYYKDGVSSTVSVHRGGDNVFLRVNGKTDASTAVDMHTQLMVGHLPTLIHPDPREALVIGFGSGITVGALAQYDYERINVVEIEPAVIQAGSFFKKENRNALENPKVKITVADARNFLLASPERYDVIISEPSNPWINGIATLFTVEFFTIARTHLNPGGIMAQWIQGYAMAPEDFKMAVASFRKAFPNATLWTSNAADYILIGSLDPMVVDMNRLRSQYAGRAGLRADLARLKMASPETIVSDFYLDEADLERFVGGADLNTDDRLPLEYSTPRSLYEDTNGYNKLEMYRAKKSRYPRLRGIREDDLERPEIQYDFARNFIEKQMHLEALQALKAVLVKQPGHVPALLDSGRIKMKTQLVLQAMEDFQSVLKFNPRSAEAHYDLGRIYLMQGKPVQAGESMRRAVGLDPENRLYRVELAGSYRMSKRYDEAADHYRIVLKQNPGDRRIMGALGATLIENEKPGEAVEVLNRAIAIDGRDARLYYQLGNALHLLGRNQEGQRAYETAIELNPRDAEAYVGLGKSWLTQGDREKAKKYFEEATALNRLIKIPEL